MVPNPLAVEPLLTTTPGPSTASVGAAIGNGECHAASADPPWDFRVRAADHVAIRAVLPAPLGPTRPTISPGRASSST